MIARFWPSRLGPQMALLTVGLLVTVQIVTVVVVAAMLPRSVPAFEPGWLVERLAYLADGAMAEPAASRPAWLAAQPEARWFAFHFDEPPELTLAPQEAQASAWLTTMVAAATKRGWTRIDVSTGRPRTFGPVAPPGFERIPPHSSDETPMPSAIVFFVATFVSPDGAVLAVRPFLPGRGQSAAIVLTAWLATFLVAASLVGWWAIARIAAPLGLLARATERFGRGISDEALPRRGAREIRTIADSFAEMRRRVARFVGDRTTMIAAISHDLRTPLTRMRLRVDRIEDAELRAALGRDIEALEAIARETLEFARIDDAPGPPDRVDLASLLQTLADERADMDQDVRCAHQAPVAVSARADALRRAIGNLIDNAVAYGGLARIAVVDLPDAVRIDIDDDGPGIQENLIEEVFRPFVRLEASRNRATGGTGLGLAIARNLARAQGGDVVLANRTHADGTRAGLRASLTLPKGV
jgi:signal transduction histidine kinase